MPRTATKSLLVIGFSILATMRGPTVASANVFEDFGKGVTDALCTVAGSCSKFTAAPECLISQVRAGGTQARHTFQFDVICDGIPFSRVSAVYDFGTGKASETISGLNGPQWSLQSSWNCSDDPWIYGATAPACGNSQVEWRGVTPFALDVFMPISVSALSQGDRHVLDAQLQNVLNAAGRAPPPPDPLADEVQDSAQDDGAVVTAIPHADLAVAKMQGPLSLLSGLSGTFIVTVKNMGNAVAPLEVVIVFAGKLDQTGQIVAGAGLACEVVTDTGINAAVRCLGGQLPGGGITTVTVQGRGQPTAGAGMLVTTLNASRSLTETNYDNNLKQLNVAINAGPTPETPQPPTQERSPMEVGMCGPPGGIAVVVIPDPNLHKLNVRTSPGGAVLATIQEGRQVSIVGECGAEQAAGFSKPPAGTGAPSGWCQIDAPVTGCVSAKFLAFGPVPDTPAAGIAAPERLSFTGSWEANAQDVGYEITLRQTGKSVTGSYAGADGSVGEIAGKVSGNVLRFSWTQTDGTRGTGKFRLVQDGQSFAGSYSLGNNPDKPTGEWNGTRR